MADRYWVGGSGSWNSTTKWSTTSGGASGASVPTATDNAFFDANSGSGNFTVTLSGTCLDLKVDGYTSGVITFAGSSQFVVTRDLLLLDGPSNITWTSTNLNIITTGTTASIDTNGVPLPYILFAKAGATYTLASDLTVTGSGSTGLYLYDGTLNTNGHTLTVAHIRGIRRTAQLNCASSNIIFNGTGSGTTAYPIFNESSFTFTPGASTVIVTGALSSIGDTPSSISRSMYNFEWTGTSSGTFTFTFEQANNLSVSAPSSVGIKQFTFAISCTINGTLSTTGTAGNRRVWFRGATYGIAQTLTINSAPSLTDADFRDIYVIGTAAPISGTRIGDLRGIRGITASTPKNCYRIGTGNWSDNQWSDTSGGSPSTDFFPLAQDTAVFDESTTAAGTLTMNAAVPYAGSVDMSARTSALTFSLGIAQDIYGNWTFGSGITISGNYALTFSGRNTQTITSAGKTFSGGITVNSYGGTVELADALNIGANTITVNNGTFDTKGYNVTAGSLSSSNSNVREIKLGASTVTLSNTNPVTFTTSTNLTLDAGTSSIVCGSLAHNFLGGNQTFYNVSFTNTAVDTHTITDANTFNSLSFTAPSSAGLRQVQFSANQTINGTLTVAGATAVRRVFVRSNTLGTPRTLTVNSLSAQDCDFRDITIAGTAAGSSPTRAGDCGGNTGITFPAAKTVYWNLAGAQNWSATGWAPSSGGTPALNNFPLAQDISVFDNTGSVTGTITINAAWNIGTFDASLRTSAMTLTTSTNTPFVYGDWKFGTGVTNSSTPGTITFATRGTETITSNGVTFGCPITIDCVTGTVQLADALTLGATRTLTLTSGTFDAVTYNVTTGTFLATTTRFHTLKMGSGLWTLTDTASGQVWSLSTTFTTLYKGTADILISTNRTVLSFPGGGFSYNKLTIGGATTTSTLTITGDNQFAELASTKTVAHTIAFSNSSQTFGKWTVTGTAGNVVTLTGTGTSHRLAGSCTSGIDYLAMGSIGFAATSPGEFYAGANSTGTAAAPVYRTAKPANSTRYWVGGTGNWSDTARWSTGSGGAGGASVPRSHDDVVFDSLSNATAYTATVNAVTGGIRTKALTIAGPASGNVTLAGSTAIVGIHGDVTLPATGLTQTYSGTIVLSGSTTGKTFTTNGVTATTSSLTVTGVGCGWTLGSATTIGGILIVSDGSFNTGGFNLTAARLSSNTTKSNTRAINLGSSTVTLNGSPPIDFLIPTNLTFNAGTSLIVCSNNNPSLNGGGQTFYNVSFTSTSITTPTITGVNTFNNLTVAGRTSAGISALSLTADQAITDTLSFLAGTDATMRQFVQSNTIGTTRTLTCANFVGTDVDFRDITIAGAAAPVSGTRLGDCKGNSGITFDAAKTVYWRAGTANWNNTASWAFTDGGTADVTAFPLAQDTAVIGATYPTSGATVTINAAYNIGTIDMQARTSNTMTLAIGSNTPAIYGNWINGTGTTLTGTGTMTFAGRDSQTITTAGKVWTTTLVITSPGGSVTLQDSFTSNRAAFPALDILFGTFDANGFNVTFTDSAAGIRSQTSNVRTVAIGSGTWTMPINWNFGVLTNLTVTGTGTISLTSASAKTFDGGGSTQYAGITLNQGGAGTLTISGNNTFKDISNSYKATGATTINFGTTTQTVSQFTAAGEAGRVLTVQGTSASSPATLVLTGGTVTTPDYLTITGVRAYNLKDTWYAGANSINNGSLGWIFASATVVVNSILSNFFLFF